MIHDNRFFAVFLTSRNAFMLGAPCIIDFGVDVLVDVDIDVDIDIDVYCYRSHTDIGTAGTGSDVYAEINLVFLYYYDYIGNISSSHA